MIDIIVLNIALFCRQELVLRDSNLVMGNIQVEEEIKLQELEKEKPDTN